ncbi:hypothetical protein IV203_004975 [Nitzschia inconspicua]|uniref:SYO1-like TPR repeats domain-containing protein n=1 Tax=Nitzschia inconspicua TaxID=303405 RepID=A0A9K3KLJ6_9STRA|nr:hypothetical protein IV203_004975 [Nitzschia inconspicua]
MGKQGRRKQRQRRKQQPLATGDAVNYNSSNSTSSGSSSSSAVHKLRHADPKIRHAALIALQATAFQPSSKPHSNPHHQRVALPVLQAVREQVLDSDLECSAVAAECLVLYLQQQQQEQNSEESKAHSKHAQQREEATASWSTVLLGRLDQCYNQIKEAQQGTAEPSTSVKKRIKAWLAVTTSCAHALCLLIETNGSALEQILLQRQKFCQILFGLLELLDDATAALYAARCMHSALDENRELADTVVLAYLNSNVWKRWLENATSDKAIMVQLHLVGSIVNLYQLVEHGRSEHQLLEDILLTYGIASSTSTNTAAVMSVAVSPTPSIPSTPEGLLTRTMKSIDLEYVTSLEVDFRSARELYESQQHDAQLEEEIIQKVNDRKEPAREIARRQKKLHDEEEQAKRKRLEEQADIDMEDVEEEIMESQTTSRGKFTKHEKDGEQAMDEVLSVWNDRIQPLQLSLEIMANLFTCWIPRDDEMVDESPMTESKNRLQQELQRQQKGLELARLVQQLIQINEHINNDTPMSPDIDETITKACACMTNCVLSNSLGEPDYASVWVLFSDMVRRLCSTSSSNNAQEASIEGLLGNMAVLVQRQPQVVRNEDLEFLHSFLSVGCGPESMKSAISVLSVAIAQATSSTMISLTETAVGKLTQTFVELLSNIQTHPSTVLEVLNAFMDWYGQDDFFPQTFDNLKVLEAMERSLNKFQSTATTFTPEEEEILYNTEQFLEYKRTQ